MEKEKCLRSKRKRLPFNSTPEHYSSVGTGGGARRAPLLPRPRAERCPHGTGKRRPPRAAGGAQGGRHPPPPGLLLATPAGALPFPEGSPHARPHRAAGGPAPTRGRGEGGSPQRSRPGRSRAPTPPAGRPRAPPPPAATPDRPASVRPPAPRPHPPCTGSGPPGCPRGPAAVAGRGLQAQPRRRPALPRPPGPARRRCLSRCRPPPGSLGPPPPAAPRRPGARLPQAVAGGGVGCISPGYIAAPGCGEGSGMRNRLGCQRHTSGRAGGGAGPRGGERRAGVGPAGGPGTPGTPGPAAPLPPVLRCAPARPVPLCAEPAAPRPSRDAEERGRSSRIPGPAALGPYHRHIPWAAGTARGYQVGTREQPRDRGLPDN